MHIALGVPTLNNFKGLAELFNSLWGIALTPFVVNNWDDNRGVSKAWNIVLDQTMSFDLTVICNDDITFAENSFQALLKAWNNRFSDCIMVTGSCGGGEVFRGMPDYSCFAINAAEYVDKIGKFDENFSPAYFE